MLRVLVITVNKRLPSTQSRFGEILTDNEVVDCKIKNERNVTANSIDSYDIIIFQRSYTLRSMLLFLDAKKRRKKTIYDIDDNILMLPKRSQLKLSSNEKKFVQTFLRSADVVTCATGRLAAFIRRVNQNAEVVPNTLSSRHFKAGVSGDAKEVKKIIISNSDYFKLERSSHGFFEALCALFGEFGSLRLIYQGQFRGAEDNTFFKKFGHRIEFREFIDNYNDYLGSLKKDNLHIALVPLEQTRFNSYKSCIKYVEFSAAGIAGVFSRVPPYTDCVRHGENGLLAENTKKSWYEQTKALVEDGDLRTKIVAAASAEALRDYEKSVAWVRWRTILEKVRGKRIRKIGGKTPVEKTIYDEFATQQRNVLRVLKRDEVMIQTRDEIIVKQDRIIVERDDVIKKQDEMIVNRDEVIRRQNNMIVERDEVIKRQDEMIVNRDEVIRRQNNMILERDDVIRRQNEVILERDGIIKTARE